MAQLEYCSLSSALPPFAIGQKIDNTNKVVMQVFAELSPKPIAAASLGQVTCCHLEIAEEDRGKYAILLL